MSRQRLLNKGVLVIVAAVACLTTSAQADIVIAGGLFVNVDAAGLPLGPITTWVNTGTLGDFTAVGSPVVTQVDGARGVTFDGSSYFDGPTSVAGLEGQSDRSIEVWAHNPAISSEETMVAWGHFGGPQGADMAFRYGSHSYYGAVLHWGWPDLDWNGAPPAQQWHHLVYTYDGTMTRIYADGVLKNSEDLSGSSLNTHVDNPIRVAASNDAGGAAIFLGTLSIGRIRIHGNALSAADVLNNYNQERANFPLNHLPVADAGPDDTWDIIGDPAYALDGSGSSDPDPGDFVAEWYWDVDGDGSADYIDTDGDGLQDTDWTTVRDIYGWQKGNVYTVKLQVADSYGAKSVGVDQVDITIVPEPGTTGRIIALGALLLLARRRFPSGTESPPARAETRP